MRYELRNSDNDGDKVIFIETTDKMDLSIITLIRHGGSGTENEMEYHDKLLLKYSRKLLNKLNKEIKASPNIAIIELDKNGNLTDKQVTYKLVKK